MPEKALPDQSDDRDGGAKHPESKKYIPCDLSSSWDDPGAIVALTLIGRGTGGLGWVRWLRGKIKNQKLEFEKQNKPEGAMHSQDYGAG